MIKGSDQSISEFLIKAVIQHGGIEAIFGQGENIKAVLIETIQRLPNEALVDIIRKAFPDDIMYTPLTDLQVSHTAIRHLQNNGIYFAGQLTKMRLTDLIKITSFTREGPRTKGLIEALALLNLQLLSEE